MGNKGVVHYFTEIKVFDIPEASGASNNGDARAPEIQILKCGKFNHPDYGTFEITPAMLQEFISNFDARVRGTDIPVDYFHEEAKIAAGWMKNLFLSDDGAELWARVEWTPRARKMLGDKELRYFSPEFQFQWEHPESGAVFNNVLFGGGLTNRPFLKNMAPIVELKEKNQGDKMNEKELKEQIKKLSEELTAAQGALKPAQDAGSEKDAKIAELEAKCADLQKQCDDMKASNEKMMAEKAQLEQDKQAAAKAQALAEKENRFNVMLSEGKVCAAQKTAFMGDNMEEFAKNAQAINLSDKGNGGNTTDKITAEKAIELAETMATEKKIKFRDAMSAVLKEHPELR